MQLRLAKKVGIWLLIHDVSQFNHVSVKGISLFSQEVYWFLTMSIKILILYHKDRSLKKHLNDRYVFNKSSLTMIINASHDGLIC